MHIDERLALVLTLTCQALFWAGSLIGRSSSDVLERGGLGTSGEGTKGVQCKEVGCLVCFRHRAPVPHALTHPQPHALTINTLTFSTSPLPSRARFRHDTPPVLTPNAGRRVSTPPSCLFLCVDRCVFVAGDACINLSQGSQELFEASSSSCWAFEVASQARACARSGALAGATWPRA